MKLLFDARALSTPYKNKGVGRQIKGISTAIELLTNKHDIHYIISNTDSLNTLPDIAKANHTVLCNSWRYFFLEDFIKLRKIIKKTDSTLFFSPISLGPLRSINTPNFIPIPIVSFVHDINVEYLNTPIMNSYKKEIRYFFERLAVKNSSHIIVPSNHTKEQLQSRKWFKNSKNKISVVYPGIDELLNNSLLSKNKNTILFIGDSEHKNPNAAISAFKIINKTNKKLKLIIIGKKHNILANSNNELLDFINSDNILIIEDINDMKLRSIIEKSKYLLMPSSNEGFGFPALDAITVGAIPIVSKNSSMSEFTKEASITINPNNENEIVNAILSLEKNSEKYNKLTALCKKCSDSFSWRKTAEQIIKIFENI